MLVLLVLFANAGEVVDRSATGFTSRNIVHVEADADTVYRVLAENVDRWWDAAHTYTGRLHEHVARRDRWWLSL